MTEKEKAKELILKYRVLIGTTDFKAKQCALICVDEITKTIQPHLSTKWWQEVKEEIIKL